MSFRLAEKTARKSQHSKHRMGAVIVKGSRILSTGHNELRYSHLIKEPTLHAEAAAVLGLLKEGRLSDLVGSEIYVTRFTRGGRVGMAKPCPKCMGLLRSVGVGRCHWTTNEGTTEELRL